MTIEGKQCINHGVGVGVLVGVALFDASGVLVAVGVGFLVGTGVLVDVVLGDGVGVPVGVGLSATVGETNIILMASSSGTGERIFLPETITPTTIAISNSNPTTTVMAARVRFLSSMASLYHFISSFFHAAKVQAG